MTRTINFFLMLLTFAFLFGTIAAALTDRTSTQTPPPAKVEGCVSCHGLIEPMHKYGTTETLEKLKDGKDAVGLSCTACHGGNPVARTKEEAHVKPLYPREWRRDGKSTGANPERTNTLLARES